MLNFISLSMCGAISSGMVLTATPFQQLPISSNLDCSTHLEALSQESVETPIHFADADGASRNGDRRGAGRRN